jgi:hypothetical protein
MTRILIGTFVGIGLLASANAAAAKPRIRELNPTTPWNVHYEEETCKLRRGFAGGDGDQLGLDLTKLTGGDGFQLALIGFPARSLSGASKLKIQFGTLAEQAIENSNGKLTVGNFPAVLVNLPGIKPIDRAAYERAAEQNAPQPDLVTPSEEAGSDSIIIRSPDTTLLLRTGSLGKPFAAWRTCVDDLVRSWGVDPSVIKTPARPVGNPGKWLTDSDYPLHALAEYKGGLVNFRLSVDLLGKPSQCSVQRAVNESLFAKTTCEILMKRANFSPALDAEGRPVPGFFISSVRFQIGG